MWGEMMNFDVGVLYLIYFIIGSVVGSFLNVCIDRPPVGKNIFLSRSQCDVCGNYLTVVDLLPILSFILLRGRCRYCQAKISARNLLIEIMTGCLFALIGSKFPYAMQHYFLWLLTALLIIQCFIDYYHKILLDDISLLILCSGIIYSYYFNPNLWNSLYGSIFGISVLLLIFFASRGGLGFGDVKLAFVLGVWLGLEKTIVFLLIAFILGGLISMILLLSRIKTRKDAIPFGPFLCAGAFIAILYGNEIINWYWRFFF